jgi:DNA-binding transcriptional regulator LsrR (DeoR family)
MNRKNNPLIETNKDTYSDILISKVAYLYYFENKNIKEIAEIFGISYPTVSRVLKRGKQRGIITINISSTYNKFLDKEKEIKEKLGLKDIIIVPTIENDNDQMIKRKVGEIAANYLANILKDGDKVGVSWGSTVYECVNSFKINKNLNVDIIQLNGSIYGAPIELNSNDLVRRIKNYFTGSYYFLTAELIVDNKEIRDAITKSSRILSTLEKHKSITKAILGIGGFNPNKIGDNYYWNYNYYWDYLKENEIKDLEEKKVVGNVSLIFYDINGNIIDNSSLNERKISISKENLLNINNSIGIATGVKKAASVLGAIKAKLLKTIIVDDKLFEELYKIQNSRNS